MNIRKQIEKTSTKESTKMSVDVPEDIREIARQLQQNEKRLTGENLLRIVDIVIEFVDVAKMQRAADKLADIAANKEAAVKMKRPTLSPRKYL
jgi:NRPS condensation-like uncharacterized protein